AKLENQESRVSEIHSLVHRLPEKNRQMLQLLMNHLAKYAGGLGKKCVKCSLQWRTAANARWPSQRMLGKCSCNQATKQSFQGDFTYGDQGQIGVCCP
ncbi:ARHGAP26 isoform 14, partial [Pan troglodytes]